MDSHSSTAGVVRFGVFELDTRSGELRRHGLKVRLPHQSFQILRLLLTRPGDVATRDELRQALWTSETFVDFDVGLNSAIRKLREALDDSAEDPRFVETLPRRGYRFIGTVDLPEVDGTGPEARTETGPEAAAVPTEPGVVAPSATRRSGVPVRAAWIAGGLFLTAAIAALGVVYARGGFAGSRAGTAAAPIRSIVVLPFENLTGDAAQDYFADGVTDALTTYLAQVDGLEVISRTSARLYKQPNVRLSAIGEELKVDAVLGGAVVRSGDRVRISAQLVDAATDRHVWARNYDDELSHILTLQQRIASDIAVAVGRRAAAPSTRARGRQTVDPEAYDAYLKGLTARGLQRYEGYRDAVMYFEEALATQPDFAEAHAALAQAQLQFLFGGPFSPRETIPKAETAARKALDLDETLAGAHRTLGQILTLYYWKWDEGDKEFQRAAELSNRLGESAEMAGTALIRSGRFAEAVESAVRERDRDPLSFGAQVNVGTAYRAAGQHDRAVGELRRAVAMNPGNTRGHFQLGVTYVAMGRIDDAIAALEIAVRSKQARNLRLEAYLGYAYAAGGRTLDARRVLSGLESLRREQYVSSFGIALIYDALGEKAPALAALERAYAERAVEFAQMTQYPAFTTIASEPGFQATMQRIGLPR